MTDDDFSAPRFSSASPARPTTLVAVVVAGLALLAVGWLWFAFGALKADTDTLRSELDARLADVIVRENSLSAALTTLNSGHAGVSKRVDDLYGTRYAGLRVTEADHLVHLAAQRLALMQDPAGALALLAAADATLKEIDDTDVHAARAALAHDIARLKEMSTLDVEALWLRLAELPEVVDTIAAATAGRPAPHADTAPVADNTVSTTTWDRFRSAVFSLVSIRRVDQPVAPVVTADERALAGQNFRLLIEQAQLALLQRRAGIYRESLVRAGAWLDRIAAGDPLRRARVRQELTALGLVEVGERLPDLSASLNATRALAAQLTPRNGEIRR